MLFSCVIRPCPLTFQSSQLRHGNNGDLCKGVGYLLLGAGQRAGSTMPSQHTSANLLVCIIARLHTTLSKSVVVFEQEGHHMEEHTRLR